MKKFLIKLLVRWYVNKLDEIYKMDDIDEVSCYRFKNNEDTIKIIKRNLTAQTLWHYQANSEEERWMAKGAANMLMIMRDCNKKALAIYKQEDPDRSLSEWRKWKKFNRVN